MEESKKLWPIRKRKKLARKMLKRAKNLAKDFRDPFLVYCVDRMIKHLDILEKEPECTQELYLQVITWSFGGRFQELLNGSNFDNDFGFEMALHNKKVQTEFILAGINIEKWLDYTEEEKVEVMAYALNGGRDEKMKLLSQKLGQLLAFTAETPLYGSLRKDCIEIEKKKVAILSGDFLVPGDWKEFLFPKYSLTLARHRAGVDLSGGNSEEFEDIQLEIMLILSALYKVPLTKKFTARLWERDPRVDLLQGNFSNCCVGIGDKKLCPAVRLPDVDCEKFPAGILNYLTDLGIQVAEIYDGPDCEKQIGQCWLFVCLDENGRPMLMADSFDIRREYKASKSQQMGIRNCMFSFLKKYATECGISKVILGRDGPMVMRDKLRQMHMVYNDVPVEDLPTAYLEKPVEKLGGYFLNRPYFLETRGGKRAHLIAENLPAITAGKTVEDMRIIREYFSMRETQRA